MITVLNKVTCQDCGIDFELYECTIDCDDRSFLCLTCINNLTDIDDDSDDIDFELDDELGIGGAL